MKNTASLLHLINSSSVSKVARLDGSQIGAVDAINCEQHVLAVIGPDRENHYVSGRIGRPRFRLKHGTIPIELWSNLSASNARGPEKLPLHSVPSTLHARNVASYPESNIGQPKSSFILSNNSHHSKTPEFSYAPNHAREIRSGQYRARSKMQISRLWLYAQSSRNASDTDPSGNQRWVVYEEGR